MARLTVEMKEKTKAKLKKDADVKDLSIKDYILWRCGVVDIEKPKKESVK